MREGSVDGIAYFAGRWPPDPCLQTLVFLHGAGGSSVLWRGQTETLAQHANTLAIDLPGHGKSPGPSEGTIAGYASRAREFVESIGAPKPVPCGHSMGGAIALQLLLEGEISCEAAILVNTGAKLRVMPTILDLIQGDYASYIKMFGQVAASLKTNPERLRSLIDVVAECDPRVALADFKACDAFDVRERLGSVEVPVLVVTGEDDALTPAKYGAFLEENIRSSTREHIVDAGHLIPVEKPEELNAAIIRFLSSGKLERVAHGP